MGASQDRGECRRNGHTPHSGRSGRCRARAGIPRSSCCASTRPLTLRCGLAGPETSSCWSWSGSGCPRPAVRRRCRPRRHQAGTASADRAGRDWRCSARLPCPSRSARRYRRWMHWVKAITSDEDAGFMLTSTDPLPSSVSFSQLQVAALGVTTDPQVEVHAKVFVEYQRLQRRPLERTDIAHAAEVRLADDVLVPRPVVKVAIIAGDSGRKVDRMRGGAQAVVAVRRVDDAASPSALRGRRRCWRSRWRAHLRQQARRRCVAGSAGPAATGWIVAASGFPQSGSSMPRRGRCRRPRHRCRRHSRPHPRRRH